MQPLRIALTKGRLEKSTVQLFEQAGMDLLQAASKDWHVSESSGRMNATQWSVVFNCRDLTAKIITGRQYDKPAHEFSLDQ